VYWKCMNAWIKQIRRQCVLIFIYCFASYVFDYRFKDMFNVQPHFYFLFCYVQYNCVINCRILVGICFYIFYFLLSLKNECYYYHAILLGKLKQIKLYIWEKQINKLKSMSKSYMTQCTIMNSHATFLVLIFWIYQTIFIIFLTLYFNLIVAMNINHSVSPTHNSCWRK
jgi:hypothetical protein